MECRLEEGGTEHNDDRKTYEATEGSNPVLGIGHLGQTGQLAWTELQLLQHFERSREDAHLLRLECKVYMKVAVSVATTAVCLSIGWNFMRVLRHSSRM